PFQNKATATNLPGGFYYVQDSDSMGCSREFLTDVSNNLGPDIQLGSLTHASCIGVCDGEIDLRITGEETIIWLPDSQITEDVSGLCGGNYYVMATDTFGCVSTKSFEIFGKKE